MTRQDKLYSMKGADLIKVADDLGIKVSCNKTRTALKESKDDVVNRIIAQEEQDQLEIKAIMAAKAEIGIKPEPIDPEKVEIISEDISSDGTPYSQVMQEIIAGAKQRSISSKLSEDILNKLLIYIQKMATASSLYFDTTTAKNLRKYRVNGTGKIVMQVWWSSRRVEIHSKSKWFTKELLKHSIKVGGNNCKWVIRDNEFETLYMIDSIISAVGVANG